MSSADRIFAYVALDARGKRLRGRLAAGSDAAVHDALRRDGLSPIRIRPAAAEAQGGAVGHLSERKLVGFLFELAALLKAGADMRASLRLLGGRGGGAAVERLCLKLSQDISSGEAVDQAFARRVGRRQGIVSALVAAGEAAGDLGAGLERAAELLEAQLKLKDKLVSTLTYPAFILLSTVAAMAVILLFIIPTLAPLVGQSGTRPPLGMGLLILASDTLRSNLVAIGVAASALIVGLALSARAGLPSRWFDSLAMSGPLSGLAARFVYGGFAITLGSMLVAGAPMTDALRLAVRAVGSPVGRERLKPVAASVRDGQSLSAALAGVRRLPLVISRLASVGEVSGSLGEMLVRGGQLEEQAAIRRVEALVQIAGPAMIVALGGLIGLLMASLLSGVSAMGQSALQ